MTGTVVHAPIAAAFGRIAVLVASDAGDDLRGARETAPRTPADDLAALFGLDDFERDVLVLTAWAELEPDAADVIAARHGNPLATEPTLALALATLPGAHWAAFSPEALLRAHALVEMEPANRVTTRALSLPESVLYFLLGAPVLSAELAVLAVRVDAIAPTTPTRTRLRDELVTALRAGPGPVIQLCGPDAAGKEAAAAQAVAATGRTLFSMPAAAVPAQPHERTVLARRWARDLRLLDGVLLVYAESGTDDRALAAFVESMAGPLVVSTADAIGLSRRPSIRLDMARPRAAEQAPLWRDALGSVADHLNGSLPRLATHFLIAPELMRTVAAELEAAPEDADLDAIAWEACRRRARPRMDDLAQRIESRAGWDDIVLPASQMRTLRAISAQVRHRAQVYEEWGFAYLASDRGLGVSALFSGPSGAGKTMAAEVLGNALGLDVYRIDLSSVVSKWIGETEKNLRRVFDAADEGSAILLFDEADALFGKRSEVKDSHDRYANIEVSYLLQRLEAYHGLAILTTNLRSNIDEAFLRRLRFVVDFPFPGAPERREIWNRAFPASCPTAALDFGLLSQLHVVGGSIRNIAMNAAFLAADQAKPVDMRDVLAAARLDYDKAGRSMTDPELRGWPR